MGTQTKKQKTYEIARQIKLSRELMECNAILKEFFAWGITNLADEKPLDTGCMMVYITNKEKESNKNQMGNKPKANKMVKN